MARSQADHSARCVSRVVVLLACAVSGCAAGDPTPSASAEPVAARGLGRTTPGAAACGTRHVATGGSDASPDACRRPSAPCATIQHAIDVACTGDRVAVAAGTYAENVVVDRSVTVEGQGEATVVVPAASNPTPCVGGPLCGGEASNVFLVRASGVTLERLRIDGDNPALTSGVVVGGADVDARNGIITDASAVYDDLTVRDVTVANVYLRGIDDASGGTFVFEHDRVQNLSDDPEAIAIFDTGGAGRITDNVVIDAAAGIASNFSRGVRVSGNFVFGTGAGIHTDNPGQQPGATADIVERNVVTGCTSNGYGYFAFAAGLGVTFRHDVAIGCYVGFADFGEEARVTSTFEDDRVVVSSIDGSVGFYITTSEESFGSSDVSATLRDDEVEGATYGVYVEQSSGNVATADVECTSVEGATAAVLTESSAVTVTHDAFFGTSVGIDATAVTSGTLAAPSNYWGCPGGPGAPGCATAAGNVDPSPVAAFPPRCIADRR